METTAAQPARKYAPPQPKDFTPSQVAALQPFLPFLLLRYGDVAVNGETALPDPICAKVAAGHCYECPVFGKEDGEWYHCGSEGYYPAPPPCVDDNRLYVSCGPNPDVVAVFKTGPQKGQPRWPDRKTSREQSMAWGTEMVARLEGLREKAAQQAQAEA